MAKVDWVMGIAGEIMLIIGLLFFPVSNKLIWCMAITLSVYMTVYPLLQYHIVKRGGTYG